MSDVKPGRYFVSVLPDPTADPANDPAAYAMGGASVVVTAAGATETVNVIVNDQPIPTAQITVYLFEDNWPLNANPDLPAEENPAARTGVSSTGPNSASSSKSRPVCTARRAGRSCRMPSAIRSVPRILPMGTSTCWGDGTLHPDANGVLTVKNLAPAKYGVIVVPPVASPAWQQTSTIEGSKVVDAWVKANEPPFFAEVGQAGPHVFFGFVQETIDADLGGTNTVSGTVIGTHTSRAPLTGLFDGKPFPGCWVALNDVGATNEMLYAAPCDDNSFFSIPNVPDGRYAITIFDTNLDMIFAIVPVDVADGQCNGGPCDLGDVQVSSWFARLEGAVFNDVNQNGFWDFDAGEGPVGPEGGPVALRWRNGTVYQAFGTDGDGLAPFDEIFPFFNWLVAEVGFGNKKATGATFWVDAGGAPDPGFADVAIAPQPQTCSPDDVVNDVDGCAAAGLDGDRTNPNTGDASARTETGPVLTQGFQGFAGQTSIMEFGKAEYLTTFLDLSNGPPESIYVGENGGISGMVHYATTRAEEDPQLAAAETWEPGVPRVQIALYADGDIDCATQGNWPADACDVDWDGDTIRDANDGVIDDINGDARHPAGRRRQLPAGLGRWRSHGSGGRR